MSTDTCHEQQSKKFRLKTDTLAHMTEISALGPSSELDVKPQVSAFSEDATVIGLDGGLKTTTGTSFAAPFVAGVVALIIEARKTRDPALIESFLTATARPQRVRKDGAFIPVPRQGDGLVRAFEAAVTRLIIQPAGLSFNDTEHFVPTLDLTIHNTHKDQAMSYNLSSFAAPTVDGSNLHEPKLLPSDQRTLHPRSASVRPRSG